LVHIDVKCSKNEKKHFLDQFGKNGQKPWETVRFWWAEGELKKTKLTAQGVGGGEKRRTGKGYHNLN